MKKKIKVALLVGGASGEREVSKHSSLSILNSLKNLEYEYKIIDPAYGLKQPQNENDYFTKDIAEVSPKNYLYAVNSNHLDGVDVVFIGLHGTYGEDGTIQAILDLKGIPYTGSKALASSISMNKTFSKIMFQHFDVQTPRWILVSKSDLNIDLLNEKIKKFFGYPCVIKPNDQGSAIGLSICRGEVELEKSLETSFAVSPNLLIEEYIDGHEITVGILDNHALPVLEIKPKHSFYDYECKYTHGMSEYEVPANLPEAVSTHLQHQALLAYNSVGCQSYARIDFRLNSKYKSYCLEVNTLPGMTDTSLLPKAAKAVGIDFDQLVDKIIKNALI